jgi:hypothetical protein
LLQRRPRAGRQPGQVQAEHGQPEHVAAQPFLAPGDAGCEARGLPVARARRGGVRGVNRDGTGSVGHDDVSRGTAARSPALMRAQELRLPGRGCCLICTMIHVDFDASSPPCVVCDPASKCPRHYLASAASRHLSQQRFCLEGRI